jgi:dipeptidyl aminopeptidase/acylaminoacyl peptidase
MLKTLFNRVFPWAIGIAAATLTACAPKPPPPPAAPAGPAYVFYYQDGAGVHRLDARSGADTLLVGVTRPRLASVLSPDKASLAIGYAGADSSRLVVVDLGGGTVRRLHSAPKGYVYSLAWSPDGQRLAVGYYTEQRVGSATLPAGGRGDVVIVTRGGAVTPVGCEASKMVYAWIAPDTIVVGDGRELYPVDLAGCRSNTFIRMAGKRGITFSPDGKHLFFYGSGQVRRGNRTVATGELYLANSDGSRARRLIGDPYDPQHAAWSPDGSKLAFDVRPPNTAALRHIAVFDLALERVRFFPSQTAEGTPRDASPVWAPAGFGLVHDRTIGGQTQKILRTLALDPSVVQTEPTVLVSGAPVGTAWGWADASHLVLTSTQWIKLVGTDGSLTYSLPGGRTLLAVIGAAR